MSRQSPLHLTKEEAVTELNRLVQDVEELIQNKATNKAATDAQKWKIGDVLNELSTLAGQAVRPGWGMPTKPASGLPAPPEYKRKFLDLREQLVLSGDVTHKVIIDYARVAAVFTLEDPYRDVLPNFSFARALSVIREPDKRRLWADKVVKKVKEGKYSVGQLRTELNSSRGQERLLLVPGAVENVSGKGLRGVYICAQTKAEIVDPVAMVELHLNPSHPVAPSSKRPWSAVFRFVNLAALADWAASHRQDSDAVEAATPADDHASPGFSPDFEVPQLNTAGTDPELVPD